MGIDNKTLLEGKTLIQKADLALSDLANNGLLVPQQAKQFMRLLINGSTLMKLATVTPMSSPKFDMPKIKFGSMILRPGTESTPVANGDRVKPDLSNVELDAKLFRGEIHLSDEQLEDTIERGQFKETVLSLLSERVGADIENIGINSDTASAVPALALFNGLIKQAVSNVSDLGATTGANITGTVFRNMLKTMPVQYLADKTKLAFLTSTNTELTYRDQLANRNTPGGDKWLESDIPVPYSGVKVIPISLFPETMGATTDRTVALLTNPKNIIFGIYRQIRIEQWRDPSEGFWKIAVSVRFDAKFADELAVVKAVNIKLA